MMAKKRSAKSMMEEELESYSKGSAPSCSNDAKKILSIIGKRMNEVKRIKNLYLDEPSVDLFGIYSNIESAFELLAEDLKKEGYTIEKECSQ